RVPRVRAGATARGAGDDLGAASGEALDLAPPLGFERRRADDEHLLDADLAREELGDTDALDRLSEPHLVREDGAARADRECDAVELIRQERLLEQRRPEGVIGRRAPDLGDQPREARRDELSLNELLGVRRDEEGVA